ncbi:unnamed protein product [Sphagnum jensenii]
MQKLLIAMFIFQQLLSGVRSQAISPVPSCGDNPAPDSIIEGPPYTNQTEINAIQDLYSAWNNTRNINSVLRGWNSSADVQTNITWDPCMEGSLNGVICYLDELQQLYKVVGLSITGNKGLTGPIPSTIGQLVDLVVLNLSFNSLIGTVENVFNLNQSNLFLLDLSSNQLSGGLHIALQFANSIFRSLEQL